ncbi:condensation domain-containing protein [Mucilaginibacter sp. KACC 22773]|uniref:condensation domain-containing protein n=1 Tax=Mucilaginibacter sp. KACC 22773 TaxID=3025671 RepID=UPI002365ABA0|nr:condensation domain-containing protein [Mucilaginibacter sp. KACC 22773]WDF77687.1 condensation domain-containing protein [Mucilaginibacter sp. KACC 22773]
MPAEIIAPSVSQKKWWLANTHPDKSGYQDALILDFYPQKVDVEVLKKTVSTLYERHESLRTIFPFIEGKIRQVILPNTLDRFDLQYYDASMLPQHEQHDFMVQKKMISFHELQNGPVSKFLLFKINDDLYNVCVVVHHIIADAWSVKILKAEMVDVYSKHKSGKYPIFESPSVQLKEYTQLQNYQCQKNKHRDINYWRLVLSDHPSALGYHEYADSDLKYNGCHLPQQAIAYVMNFTDAAHAGILSSSLSLKFGLSSVFYTGFLISLNLLNKTDRMVFASPVANRFLNKFNNTIGCLTGGIYFVHTLNHETTISDVAASFCLNLVSACRHIIFDHGYLDLNESYLRGNCHLYANLELNKLSSESLIGQDSPAGYQQHQSTYYALECAASQYQDAFAFRWSCNLRFFKPSFLETLSFVHKNVMSYIVAHPDHQVKDLLQALKHSELSDTAQSLYN